MLIYSFVNHHCTDELDPRAPSWHSPATALLIIRFGHSESAYYYIYCRTVSVCSLPGSLSSERGLRPLHVNDAWEREGVPNSSWILRLCHWRFRPCFCIERLTRDPKHGIVSSIVWKAIRLLSRRISNFQNPWSLFKFSTLISLTLSSS